MVHFIALIVLSKQANFKGIFFKQISRMQFIVGGIIISHMMIHDTYTIAKEKKRYVILA